MEKVFLISGVRNSLKFSSVIRFNLTFMLSYTMHIEDDVQIKLILFVEWLVVEKFENFFQFSKAWFTCIV